MQSLLVRSVVIAPGMDPIQAVKLEDGSLGAMMYSLCKPLDISRQGQGARIRRNPDLARALIVYSYASPTGPRMVDVLLSWAIPLWLSGLQIERLAPQKQELARILKSGACEAIERAFKGDAPETPVKALPASDAWQQAQEGQEGVASAEARYCHPIVGSSKCKQGWLQWHKGWARSRWE